MVILRDSFYPGWKAYRFVRGVVALAGAHQIERRFRPGSVFAGGAYFELGLLLTVICLLV